MPFNFTLKAALFLLMILYVTTAGQDSPVVAEFGKYSIYLDEFERAYAKNMGGVEEAKNDSMENYKNFLDLYVTFRMKLRDAQVRAYDRDEDLIKEFDTYRKQVGSAYLIEKEIVEPNLLLYYEDQKSEVRVSHILIRLQGNFDQTKKRAMEVIEKINNGGDFAQLALEYSDDQNTKNIGGDIYWLIAGQIVPQFEKAIFDTEVGEIYPEPVRTNFGYHIIKVTARQERRYQLRARHIMAAHGTTPEDTAAAIAKIGEVIIKLNAGEDFGELAKQYSDDKNSGARGGDLGFVTRRMMVQPFDEALFNLKIGERSDIVNTRFGFHVIELTEEKPFPEYSEMEEKLKEQYKKTRYEPDMDKYAENLKTKYGYDVNYDLIDKIVLSDDTLRFDETYLESDFREMYKDETVFTIGASGTIVDSIFSFAQTENKLKGKMVNRTNSFMDAVNLLSRKLLFEEAAVDLEKTNKEFGALMDDYRNGIFIFRLQEEEVWSRLKIDSAAVKNYYETNKTKYVMPDRVDFSEIMVHKDSLANAIYSQLKNGADFDSLAGVYTRRPTYKQKNGYHGIKDVSSSDLSQKAYTLGAPNDISEPFKSGANWSIIRLNEKHPSRIKTFEEARAEAASDYQELMVENYEEMYINKLKDLYKPQYHYEVLNNAFKDNTN